jgi:hypothetical protein
MIKMRVNKKNIYNQIGWCIFTLSLVAIGGVTAVIFGYLTISQLGILDSISFTDKMLLSFASAISFFMINLSFKTKVSVDEINEKLEKQPEDIANVKVLNNKEEFYACLQAKTMESKNRVWLMHLDTYAPTSKQYNDNVRKNYFQFSEDFARTHKNVKIKRIMSLSNKEKLDWVTKLIERTKNVNNLYLAYIKIDGLEDSFPKTMVSCQIIDDDKLFLLNPALNIVPGGDFNPCLYIENKEIVKIYAKYYEDLWHDAKFNHNSSCFLKDGPNDYNKNLKIIEEHINLNLTDSDN